MKKVLIVDDASFMRFQLRKILEKHEFAIVGEAENGISAIQRCKELQPDIVTLDITMPEMDGLQALEEIRKNDPGCKVVMISAMGQEPFIREAILKGAKDFIAKPFKEESVIEKMKKLI